MSAEIQDLNAYIKDTRSMMGTGVRLDPYPVRNGINFRIELGRVDESKQTEIIMRIHKIADYIKSQQRDVRPSQGTDPGQTVQAGVHNVFINDRYNLHTQARILLAFQQVLGLRPIVDHLNDNLIQFSNELLTGTVKPSEESGSDGKWKTFSATPLRDDPIEKLDEEGKIEVASYCVGKVTIERLAKAILWNDILSLHTSSRCSLKIRSDPENPNEQLIYIEVHPGHDIEVHPGLDGDNLSVFEHARQNAIRQLKEAAGVDPAPTVTGSSAAQQKSRSFPPL